MAQVIDFTEYQKHKRLCRKIKIVKPAKRKKPRKKPDRQGHLDILTSRTDSQATLALSHLKEDVELMHWRNYLRLAYYQHTRKKREANFTVPKFGEIKSILSNAVPSRTSDLFALICDHLSDLAKVIRTESPAKYRFFWNTDSHHRLYSSACITGYSDYRSNCFFSLVIAQKN